MGFCYLNNVAIAALEALATGAKRVAVFDFDVHHGNGTEAMLLNKPDAPSSPSTNSRAIPAPARGTSATTASTTRCCRKPRAASTCTCSSSALEHLGAFKPGLVAVSAGFDAYARDPLAQGSLETEDFYWLGQSLRNLGVPLFSVLEGGYSADLPGNGTQADRFRAEIYLCSSHLCVYAHESYHPGCGYRTGHFTISSPVMEILPVNACTGLASN